MADIGLVGLGVMGANLALNMAEKGYSVAVYNRTAAKTDTFIKEAGKLAPRLTACYSL
jgi:6-phosphogluconate dehydrogenase